MVFLDTYFMSTKCIYHPIYNHSTKLEIRTFLCYTIKKIT